MGSQIGVGESGRRTTMRILVSFDKFKGSLSAREACAIARAELEAKGHAVVEAPLTDGGDGFAELLTRALDGEWTPLTVEGPLGTPVQAHVGTVDATAIPRPARLIGELPDTGRVALVDIASSSGIVLVREADRNPWKTTTRGLGELIAEAARRDASAILVGLGGSATSDLALNALCALGLRARLRSGDIVERVPPAMWPHVVALHGKIMGDIPPVRLACDVTNPLLGPRGAVGAFAPQKGLRAEDARALENQTRRMAMMLADHVGAPHALMEEPGAGAAGGAGFGLRAAMNAQLVPGFDLVAEWLSIPQALDAADLLITGEGRFDRSSLEGKGPGALIQMAHERGVPVRVFAGSVEEEAVEELVASHGEDAVVRIVPPGQSMEEAMKRAAENLRQAIAAG
jgi:glycerate kinase